MDGLNYILQGVPIVIIVWSITLAIAFVVSLIIVSVYTTRMKFLQLIVTAYIFIFRGTPLLLQLLFFYFGIPALTGFAFSDPLSAAIFTFSLNYTAYTIEIMRSGLNAIDSGQYEAAYVLGYKKWQTLIYICYPQMLRITLPTLANEVVSLVKDTALLSVISVAEITRNTRELSSALASITPYIYAGIIYLILTTIISVFFRLLERKFSTGGVA